MDADGSGGREIHQQRQRPREADQRPTKTAATDDDDNDNDEGSVPASNNDDDDNDDDDDDWAALSVDDDDHWAADDTLWKISARAGGIKFITCLLDSTYKTCLTVLWLVVLAVSDGIDREPVMSPDKFLGVSIPS